MSTLQRRFVYGLVLLLLGCAPALAQTVKKPEGIKNKYQNIEVASFEIEEGVKLPPESRDVIMTQVVEELAQLKKFKEVSDRREATPQPEGPTVRLIGAFTKYNAGSRAKRYFIGFGAGTTKVVARIKFVDVATGETLLERYVDGKVWIGLFGGDSSGATRGLAKEVAKVTKKLLF
jgi:hypothetical protein